MKDIHFLLTKAQTFQTKLNYLCLLGTLTNPVLYIEQYLALTHVERTVGQALKEALEIFCCGKGLNMKRIFGAT